MSATHPMLERDHTSDWMGIRVLTTQSITVGRQASTLTTSPQPTKGKPYEQKRTSQHSTGATASLM